MRILSDYTLLEEVTEGPDTLLLRGIRAADGHPVLVKLLKEDYPPLSAVARLRAEDELTRELRMPGLLTPLGIESPRHGVALIFDDFAGMSLRRRLATGPLDLALFLPVAIELADTLGELHAHRVIHKGLTPEGILVNPEHARIALTDLSHATRLLRENHTPGAVDRLEGMLAYVSPEQTGRMNRTIDCRSDLYSLGVILYEMLTGVRLFEASDALELIHFHIARPPTSPVVHRPDCPPVLARLVLKLLAKTAEDRYQSAAGLAADLREVSRQWGSGASLADFSLGQHDLPSTLTLCQKLYGRERELEQLLAAVQRVERGGVELLLVSGHAGVGKTSLVHELHKPLAAWRGHLASGKFDQLQRDVPYSALAQAFRQLLRILLAEPPPSVAAWRESLLAARSRGGGLMVDLLPELELLIGPQPAVAELPGTESRGRFHQAFVHLVAALGRPERPLVLFLDDVQWVDSASLELLPQLLTAPSVQGLLMLWAYRESALPPEHPLRRLVDQLRQEGRPVAELALGPLGAADVRGLLADSLGAPLSEVGGLADTLLAKTGGNPFFLHQLLHSLYADGLLVFDRDARRWRWDLALLQRVPYTDNVVVLMAERIQRLPPAMRDVLTRAACVGNAFDLHTLVSVSEAPAETTAQLLQEAAREGLLLLEEGVHYRFLHDRVQQAAYSLIAEEERPSVHLKIGRLLWRKEAGAGKVGFDAVNHLNLGRELLEDAGERQQVAALNLEAGRRAKAASAYASAAGYFRAGCELLGAHGWEDCFELRWELAVGHAECEYLLTHFAEAEALFDLVQSRARTRIQRAHATRIQVILLTNLGKYQEAFRRGVEALRLFGLDWPEDDAGVSAALARQYEEIERALRRRPLAELMEFPEERDPDRLALELLLAHLISPSYLGFANKEHIHLVTCTLVGQVLRAGRNSDATTYGFSCYAHLLVSKGEYASGHAFGKLAIDVAEKHDFHFSKGRNYNIFGVLINHWTCPAHTSSAYLARAFTLLSQSGDIIYSVYACSNLLAIAVVRGDTLEQVEAEFLRYFDFVRQSQYQQFVQPFSVYRHLLRALRGQAETPWSLPAPDTREATPARALWALNQMKLLYLAGRPEEALAVGGESEARISWHYDGTLLVPESRFFFAMAVAAARRGPAGEPPQPLLERAAEVFRPWAASCPANFRQQLLLIEAELARLSGRELDAMRLYDEAIVAAEDSGYLHLEALGNELAAQLHLQGGRPRMAQGYLREACYAYARWGATAKVAQLEANHPGLLGGQAVRAAPRAGEGMTSSPALGGSGLDLLTVTKSSQALSGEVHLRSLLEKLLRIAMENAGSQRAVLLLARGGELFIEAEATVDRADVAVLQSLPVEATETLPRSVINYVAHSEDSLLLGDALATAPYQSDPYIATRRTRSILCLPVITQKRRVGILYLEHHSAPEVFTRDRHHVLTLLSAQAAISIENAQLYNTLEQRVADRTWELNEKNDQLAQALRQLQEIQHLLVEKEKLASLGAMNAAIAHEVKNPLNFINNFARLAGKLGEELVAEVNRVERAPSGSGFSELRSMAKELAQLTTKVQEHGKRVERIIDAMRQHSAGQRVVRRPVDLNQFLSEHVGLTLQGLRAREPSLPVQLSTRYDESVGLVQVAPDELGRVITNLVTNAWQAVAARHRKAPTPPPLLEVSTRDLSSQVEVRVRDNGVGIPPEYRGRIFSPFFTTKPPGEGVGLGLSLSHNVVVQLHGGSMRFESKPDWGTEFIVTLPRS